MSEILAIVDNYDEILEGIDRAIFDKSTGKIYRTVSLVVINKKGEILIQKRALNKTYPGLWDIAAAAGHVLYGENYQESAIREAKEEVGLDVTEMIPLKKFFHESQKGHRRFMQTYLAVMDASEDDVVIQPEEVMEAKFLPLDEVKRMIEQSPELFRDLAAEVLNQALEVYEKDRKVLR